MHWLPLQGLGEKNQDIVEGGCPLDVGPLPKGPLVALHGPMKAGDGCFP